MLSVKGKYAADSHRQKRACDDGKHYHLGHDVDRGGDEARLEHPGGDIGGEIHLCAGHRVLERGHCCELLDHKAGMNPFHVHHQRGAGDEHAAEKYHHSLHPQHRKCA